MINIEMLDKAVYSLCEVESVTDYDRACCKVILTLSGDKYNIMNFNIRALKEDTAQGIRTYLREFGLFAAVEYVGKKSKVSIDTNRYKNESKTVVVKSADDVGTQLSMFGSLLR